MNQRPQDLVFTLFGEYLLHRPGPVWVGSLIRLLKPFGLSEGAVRTVLSRMARKGWLSGNRQGRHSFYDLTPKGRRLLEEGEARIFQPHAARAWDGEWFLLAYSIPEGRRRLRDRLRVRLAWLGFGSLGNGLWISPHDVGDQVSELAAAMGIEDHLECFRARHVSHDADALVRHSWDLDAIHCRYQSFLGRWVPVGERAERSADTSGLDPEEAFVLRFRLIHEFREFLLEDPYLPETLLPKGWLGGRAHALVESLHDLFAEPADRYVDGILEPAPLPATA